jgi:hypothetical protein
MYVWMGSKSVCERNYTDDDCWSAEDIHPSFSETLVEMRRIDSKTFSYIVDY